ncbi:MAG TPA: translocation/assembly module TamB domain-containing protein, partial [Steroidobacteraceae bacterium]|nr:translocation/assembly module TamB domain-containing protein [Steroidobacteraceae bacterium]
QARGRFSSTQLAIDRLHLDALRATADGSEIEVSLPLLDSVRARVSATAPGLTLSANGAMSPQTGGGTIAMRLTSAQQTLGWLRGLPLLGARLPELSARGAATLDASWKGSWRQWMSGLTRPASQPDLHLDAVARSEGLALELPATAVHSAIRVDVRKLDFNAQGNLAAATLAIEGDARVNDLRAMLDARMKTTQVPGSGNAPRWITAVEKFAAAMTLPEQDEPWQLQLSDNLQLAAQFGKDIELQASAGSATLQAPTKAGGQEPLKVTWQPVTWHRTAGGAMTLQSAGDVSGIQPAWLDALLAHTGKSPLADAGIRTDMVLSGEWDARLTDHIAIRGHLQRNRGDLVLVKSSTSAGIRTLDLTVQAADENVSAALDWDTEHAGVITARVATRLRQQDGGWTLPPTAPLSGVIQAKLRDLATLAFLAPPGWRIQGELDADMRLAGTLQRPRLEGGIEGRQLNIRSALDGVDLHNGTLRAALRDSRMEVSELTFEGGTGSRAYVRGFSGNRTPPPAERGRMLARGFIDWSRVMNPATADARAAGSRIVMNLDAEMQRMQVLVRHDRQMTLSGKLSAGLDEGTLRVRGDLRVDRASIMLPERSAPTPGDDVVITRTSALRNAGAVEARQAHGELQTRKPMDMEIRLDLGRDLALEGQGITTRLEGELTVRSATAGADPFRVFGEVRTVEGRYRAWGQALDVETGIVRFNGPYGNPTLDLLAIRPKIEVRAGVRVTGTLLAPRVQLFSEPELPEGEKLSWVVLGRATIITSTEGSSMQQA